MVGEELGLTTKAPCNFRFYLRVSSGLTAGTAGANEVIKVAGHRLGTYELESALIHHPAVAEAAAVAVPDEIKSEVPVAFVILRAGHTSRPELDKELHA